MKRAVGLLLLALAFDLRGEALISPRVDEWNLSIAAKDDPIATARDIARRREGNAARANPVDLRAERVTDSLAGRHVFLREHLNGYPVLNGGFSITIDPDGSVTSLHDRRSRARVATVLLTARQAVDVVTDAFVGTMTAGPSLVGWIDDDGVARLVWRVTWKARYDEWMALVDGASGRIIHSEPLFFSADGRVFDPNPVTALNQPALRDNDDSADAVPESSYVVVPIDGLSVDDRLEGPHVTVTDLEAPSTVRAKPSAGLLFDRSQDEFEEVMAYFHIDRSQRYMQSLGFVGARAIVPYSIRVDAHGLDGDDNSNYRFSSGGRGQLSFGDGGVDDAEDADIILHEYGHAIQDSIVPAGFTGSFASEPRALGEAFGDYWAFSSAYAANIATGSDPFCIGNWDARCGDGPSTNCAYSANSTCLRRVDGTKTMADYVRNGGTGTEHQNGEIWSSALRDVFLDAVAMSGLVDGRRLADRTILESHFGMPPNPSFRTAAIRLLDADRRLNARRLERTICSAMTRRSILEDADCDSGLRGDVTMIQSPVRGTPIPDDEPAGISSSLTISDTRVVESIFVAVDVRHPRRGDLRMTLVAPDGETVVIQTESGSAGADIIATYGLDTPPSQPLFPLTGKPGPGTWTLNVADTQGSEAGELHSWSLLIRFAGDEPLAERGRPRNERLHVAVTGTTAGAVGTKFVSDVRLFNSRSSVTSATLIFTPSGQNGLENFGAITLSIAPEQVVALDDVVSTAFRTGGTGSIEVRGDPSALVVSSRIYNEQPEGTFGQFLFATPSSAGATKGNGALHIVQLQNTPAFRSNIGIAELDGNSGDVELQLFDAAGTLVTSEVRTVQPYSHVQFPVLGGVGGSVIGAARAKIRVIDGEARITAYGSSVDNRSGDAVLVPGARIPRQADVLIVPAVIHAEGAEGTSWRSDLWLLNGRDDSSSLSLTLYPSTEGTSRTTSLVLAPGELRRLDDVVAQTFETLGTGSIEIRGEGLASLIVTSRAWNDAAVGSFGQFIEAVPRELAIAQGERAGLAHIDSDGTYRANIGLTEVDGSPVTARVRLFDASGIETFSIPVELGSRENRQMNLSLAGAPPTKNGRVLVEVVSGGGRVVAYASIVDNRTGDAIYVPER